MHTRRFGHVHRCRHDGDGPYENWKDQCAVSTLQVHATWTLHVHATLTMDRGPLVAPLGTRIRVRVVASRLADLDSVGRPAYAVLYVVIGH